MWLKSTTDVVPQSTISIQPASWPQNVSSGEWRLAVKLPSGMYCNNV